MGHGACSGHWSGFISDSDRSQRRGLDEWVVTTSLRQNRMRAKSRRLKIDKGDDTTVALGVLRCLVSAAATFDVAIFGTAAS